jgi:hypothetical protein
MNINPSLLIGDNNVLTCSDMSKHQWTKLYIGCCLCVCFQSITENLKLNYNKVVKTEKILLGSLSSDSGFGCMYFVCMCVSEALLKLIKSTIYLHHALLYFVAEYICLFIASASSINYFATN